MENEYYYIYSRDFLIAHSAKCILLSNVVFAPAIRLPIKEPRQKCDIGQQTTGGKDNCNCARANTEYCFLYSIYLFE